MFHAAQHAWPVLYHMTGHAYHHSITAPYPIDAFQFALGDFFAFNVCVYAPLVFMPMTRHTHVAFLTLMSVNSQLEHAPRGSWVTDGHFTHHAGPGHGCGTVMTFGLCARDAALLLMLLCSGVVIVITSSAMLVRQYPRLVLFIY